MPIYNNTVFIQFRKLGNLKILRQYKLTLQKVFWQQLLVNQIFSKLFKNLLSPMLSHNLNCMHAACKGNENIQIGQTEKIVSEKIAFQIQLDVNCFHGKSNEKHLLTVRNKITFNGFRCAILPWKIVYKQQCLMHRQTIVKVN